MPRYGGVGDPVAALPRPWGIVAVVALVFVLALVTLTVIVLVLGISPHPWCRWPW